MDTTESYPDIYNQVHYGLQKQTPSYQSEFPQDLPYDPGATSSLFELNYFPSTGSRLLFVVPLIVIFFLITSRKYIKLDFESLLFISALVLVFFGPFRLPSFFPFNTTLGLVKALGLLSLVLLGVNHIFKKRPFDLVEAESFFPVCAYIVSLLLSVLVMTNATFFLQDFGIVLTGIIFYYISFMMFSWKTVRTLLLTWARLLLIAGGFVLLIFLSNDMGTQIMSLIYQRYENFVFLQDLNRNRIFSVIDFEYFVPAVALFIVDRTGKTGRISRLQFYLITAVSFAAILLVNYRYRFLTYLLGFVLLIIFTKEYRTVIRTAVMKLFVILGLLYFSLSFVFSRGTIIDRFLMRSHGEDVVSVERRFVMYQQAWELFTQRPLLGVGLGNYKDNVQIVYSLYGGRTYEPYYKILQNVYAYPHNWFLNVLAENGIVGFIILMWLLYTFALIDLRLYRKLKGEKLLVSVILSAISWLYVFANLFTMMNVSLPMVIVFWACRGLIDRINYSERRSVKTAGVGAYTQ